jgi:hypothetical protein
MPGVTVNQQHPGPEDVPEVAVHNEVGDGDGDVVQARDVGSVTVAGNGTHMIQARRIGTMRIGGGHHA